MEQVLFSAQSNGIGSIILNRPKALNSISDDMLVAMYEKLQKWEVDDAIKLIVLQGAGSKAFCAGGDIKSIYEVASKESAVQDAEFFFEKEYELDQYLYRYPKPVIACLDGIVMGGGVGLANGCSHRIVTEKTKWAMPEMNIGFFPDVGAAYFLNKAPGKVGRYLALTASVISAADVLYINAADVFISSEKLADILNEITAINWNKGEEPLDTLNRLLKKYAERPSIPSQLLFLEEEINHHFSFPTMEEIIHSLELDSSDFAVKTKAILLSKSPASLKVALKQLIDGEEKTMEECFATDLVLAKNFMRHQDFYEGIRSVLIDKDNLPHYTYKHLSDVDDAMVQEFFIK